MHLIPGTFEMSVPDLEVYERSRDKTSWGAIVALLVLLASVIISFFGTILNPENWHFLRKLYLPDSLYTSFLRATEFLFVGQKIGVLLTETHLDDKTNIASVGKVHWEDIFDVQPLDHLAFEGIAVFIDNPDSLYAQSSETKNWLLDTNRHYFGTPCIITTDGLFISRDELLSKITTRITIRKARLVDASPSDLVIGSGNYAPRPEYLVPYIETPAVTRHAP